MEASLSQLTQAALQTMRLTELNQRSGFDSRRAVAESLDALARSRDLLAQTSAMIPG